MQVKNVKQHFRQAKTSKCAMAKKVTATSSEISSPLSHGLQTPHLAQGQIGVIRILLQLVFIRHQCPRPLMELFIPTLLDFLHAEQRTEWTDMTTRSDHFHCYHTHFLYQLSWIFCTHNNIQSGQIWLPDPTSVTGITLTFRTNSPRFSACTAKYRVDRHDYQTWPLSLLSHSLLALTLQDFLHPQEDTKCTALTTRPFFFFLG